VGVAELTGSHDREEIASGQAHFLGELLVEEGLLTEAQLRDALRAQKQLKAPPLLGQILVDQRMLTQAQLDSALERYHKKYRLGDILVKSKAITEEQLQTALQHQARTGFRLGYVLLQLNFLTEEQLKRALARQLNVPFVDLDAYIIDPRLSSLINRRYATQHRVAPIAKSETCLTLAMDDPTDLMVLDQLRASTGMKIDVVTSTRAAFNRALARAYATPESAVAASTEEEKAPTGAPPLVAPGPEASARPPVAPRPDPESALGELESRGFQPRAGEGRSESTSLLLARLATAWQALGGEQKVTRQEVRELRERSDATAQSLARLQAAHDALRQEYSATVQALQDQNARYASFLQDRQSMAEAIEAVVRRLRPTP
jgi:hypothetical protein